MTFLGPKFDPQRAKIFKKKFEKLPQISHYPLYENETVYEKNLTKKGQNLRDSVRLRHYFPFSKLTP